jgi:hypothetical protein
VRSVEWSDSRRGQENVVNSADGLCWFKRKIGVRALAGLDCHAKVPYAVKSSHLHLVRLVRHVAGWVGVALFRLYPTSPRRRRAAELRVVYVSVAWYYVIVLPPPPSSAPARVTGTCRFAYDSHRAGPIARACSTNRRSLDGRCRHSNNRACIITLYNSIRLIT